MLLFSVGSVWNFPRLEARQQRRLTDKKNCAEMIMYTTSWMRCGCGCGHECGRWMNRSNSNQVSARQWGWIYASYIYYILDTRHMLSTLLSSSWSFALIDIHTLMNSTRTYVSADGESARKASAAFGTLQRIGYQIHLNHNKMWREISWSAGSKSSLRGICRFTEISHVEF